MADTITPFGNTADDTSPFTECVACGEPCPPRERWCSKSCLYAEDGYPDDDPVDPRDEADWDSDDTLLDKADDAYWDEAA